MQSKKSSHQDYEHYVSAAKAVLASESIEHFPRVIFVSGPSSYLQIKTFEAIRKLWQVRDWGVVHSVELSELDQREFQALVSQRSLFETRSLYILRRAGAVKSFGSWLSVFSDPSALKSHIVLDGGDKMSPDLVKQLTRLNAVNIPCYEPSGVAGFRQVAVSLAKRHQVNLAEDALSLVLETAGYDLNKIENELIKLALQFSGVGRQLQKSDISSSLGILREDDIFDLFRLLRERKLSKVHLMTESFLNRGESPIAITGIFARYAREQIDRGSKIPGSKGLRACVDADRLLKTSATDDLLVLTQIIEAFAEV